MGISKRDMIDTIVNRSTSGMNKRQAEEFVELATAIIEDAVSSSEELNLFGLAKVKVVAKPERQGVNPSTGEKITIAAKNHVKIKPLKRLQDAANV